MLLALTNLAGNGEVSTESGRACVKTQSRERKGDELTATRYRTASGSDRMRALNLRSDVSFASVESCIRSLPLAVLYRVAASPAIKSSSSFTRPNFHTDSVAGGSNQSMADLTRDHPPATADGTDLITSRLANLPTAAMCCGRATNPYARTSNNTASTGARPMLADTT